MPHEKQTIFSKRLIPMLFFGFSSGLPFLATRDPLQAWMKESGFDLKTIGAFALAGLPYSFKFLWAPFFDRYVPPLFGRRRGWALLMQFLLAIALLFLAYSNPSTSLERIAFIAVIISFLSASQDIVLDAQRREYLSDRELGLGSSMFVTGYRIGLLVAGAFALWLSTFVMWSAVYAVLSMCMIVGIVTTFLTEEPQLESPPPKSFRDAVVLPFEEFFKRSGAWELLLFILLYKLGDTLASTLTTPFFLEIGFQKAEIAKVAKTFGLGAAIVGGIVGGIYLTRSGILRGLYVLGLVQAAGILAFAVLAISGANIWALAGAVTAENLTSGMGTAAYAACMAKLCDKRFTATQYSLFSSLMAVPRSLFAASTGVLASMLGWPAFFLLCTAAALPGLLLLRREALVKSL